MDDAKTFCRNELRKRGNPPQMELDDILQEWSLAELQGLNPRAAVAKVLRRSVKEGKNAVSNDKMHLYPEEEREVMSEEEWGNYLDTEREIAQETLEQMMPDAWKAGEALEKENADDWIAFKLHHGLEGKERNVKSIARIMKKTEVEVEYLLAKAKERLWQLGHPEPREMPLFGETDMVVVAREVYRRKGTGHFKRQEADMFDKEVAA